MINVTKLLIICSLLAIIGCQKKEPPSPAFNIRGIKTSIAKIQISPLAFDGAQVVVLGFVKEIKNSESQHEKNLLILTDDYGNSINVESEEVLDFEENDILVVGGKYRKNSNLIISDEIVNVIIDKEGIRPSNDLEK
ncbi:MAG: hypothetical protein ACR2NW_03800 [Thermodesulfobacteriota bacterium]